MTIVLSVASNKKPSGRDGKLAANPEGDRDRGWCRDDSDSTRVELRDTAADATRMSAAIR